MAGTLGKAETVTVVGVTRLMVGLLRVETVIVVKLIELTEELVVTPHEPSAVNPMATQAGSPVRGSM